MANSQNTVIEDEIYSLASDTIGIWTGISSNVSIERFRVLWAIWAYKHDPNQSSVSVSFMDFMHHWEIPTVRGIAEKEALRRILSEFIGDDY